MKIIMNDEEFLRVLVLTNKFASIGSGGIVSDIDVDTALEMLKYDDNVEKLIYGSRMPDDSIELTVTIGFVNELIGMAKASETGIKDIQLNGIEPGQFIPSMHKHAGIPPSPEIATVTISLEKFKDIDSSDEHPNEYVRLDIRTDSFDFSHVRKPVGWLESFDALGESDQVMCLNDGNGGTRSLCRDTTIAVRDAIIDFIKDPHDTSFQIIL